MIQYVSKALAICIAIDAAIVFMTMLQIAQGVPTPHIAFWDAQIRAVVAIINH